MIVSIRINNWEDYFKIKKYLISLNFKWFRTTYSPKFDLIIHLSSGKLSYDPRMNKNDNYEYATVKEIISKGFGSFIF